MTRIPTTRLPLALAAVAVIAAGALAIVLISGGSDSGAPSATASGGAGQPAGGDGKGDRKGKADRDADAEANLQRQPEEQEASKQPEETEEEQEARRTAESLYALLAGEQGDKDSTNLDSAAFCELMSERAERQTVRYAKRSSGIARRWNCESAVEHLVLRSKRTGGLKRTRKAQVVGVNAEGERATASVRLGKRITSIPLVREDGEWRLAASPAGGAS